MPGTPTDRPLVTAVLNGYGAPVAGSMNIVSPPAIGVVSRPSMVETVRVRAS
jgi:hypothetical protein